MSKMSICTDYTANEAMDLVERIKPLLAGKGPAVQGACLAELTSLWLACHDESLREGLMRLQDETIRALVPVHARALRGER